MSEDEEWTPPTEAELKVCGCFQKPTLSIAKHVLVSIALSLCSQLTTGFYVTKLNKNFWSVDIMGGDNGSILHFFSSVFAIFGPPPNPLSDPP